MYGLLYLTWRFRKTVKKARVLRVAQAEQAEGFLRSAMAYAWEIGEGRTMRPSITASANNPFLNPKWREGVIPDGT